ncbi:MAG: hypothetical protein D6780_00815 [Candidatus Dadabacteria bacterium]|nr:MAG: hypothetical protein D6780_00815 [Candidatus Dadabacteria bacterium]
MKRKVRAFNTVIKVENEFARYQPLINNEYTELLALSVLARALRKCEGIVLCHYVFLPWGYKMIITGDPSQYSAFMNYFGGELAKCLKESLGLSYENIWARKFDEEILHSPLDVNKAITEIYLEPLLKGVCQSLKSYGNMSSWNMFKSALKVRDGTVTIEVGEVSQCMIDKVKRDITEVDESQIYLKLNKKIRCNIKLEVKPFGWKKCFSYTKKCGKKKMFNKFKATLSRKIKESKDEIRKKKKRAAKGRIPLKEIYKRYKPKRRKKGEREYIRCSHKKKEKKIKERYAFFCIKCDNCYKGWKESSNGQVVVEYPKGAFVPTGPPYTSLQVAPSLEEI